MEDAICHGTREPAWSAHLEKTTGMLKAGKAADIVVLDRDFFAEGPRSLLSTDVSRVLMNGKVVYSA
jgi:hypothetical protein